MCLLTSYVTHIHTHAHTHTHVHTQLVEIKKSIRSLLQVLVPCYDMYFFTPISIVSHQYFFTWHVWLLVLPPLSVCFFLSIYQHLTLFPSIPLSNSCQTLVFDLREDKCEVWKYGVHMLLVCFHVCVHTACISIYLSINLCMYVYVCMHAKKYQQHICWMPKSQFLKKSTFELAKN